MNEPVNISPIEKLADKVIAEIKKLGIHKWDLYLYDEQINGIHFRKTEKELDFESHDLKFFIRVFKPINDRLMGMGAVELNATDPTEIQKAIQRAASIASIHHVPAYDLISPELNLKYPNPDVIDSLVWNNPQVFIESKNQELTQLLSEIMRAETSFGKFRVYKTQKMLVNSSNFRKIKNSTHFYYEFSFRAISKPDKRMAEYWTSGKVKSVDQLRFRDLIPEWSTMAKDSLRAQPPKYNPSIDVLFTPKLVRIALLETIGKSITGTAEFTKTTPFKIGEKVAHEKFSLIDDGIADGGLHTSAWDSEGFPKQRTVLIKNGIMNNFIYDQTFATLLHKKSTGNAQRYPQKGGNMEIEINNLMVEPGNHSLKEIVENSQEMIYVNKFSWLRPNPITGDFGATIMNGYLIKNGKIDQPIRGGTLYGNIYQMLHEIEAISKERRVVENSLVPFIKFKNLRLTAE